MGLVHSETCFRHTPFPNTRRIGEGGSEGCLCRSSLGRFLLQRQEGTNLGTQGKYHPKFLFPKLLFQTPESWHMHNGEQSAGETENGVKLAIPPATSQKCVSGVKKQVIFDSQSLEETPF